MSERLINFSAGPSMLPPPVLERAREDLLSLPGVGASAMEVSHRGAWFTDVIDEAEANLRSLLGISDTHRVAFCQGGATLQFSMAPMNFLRGRGRQADYLLTGGWSSKALAEARKEGTVRVAWSGKDEDYVRVPDTDELLEALSAKATYVHMTSNETIQGVEYPDTPIVPDAVPLIADASSDFLSRPLEIGRYGLVYAGAQKNAGPAGLTIAIVREDLLQQIPEDLPTMLDYRTYTEHGSRYNTPPVFAIYMLMLVTRWLRDDVGGLDAMLQRNRQKAGLLYDVLDESPGFFVGHAQPQARSLMNVTFRLPSEDLEERFVAEAAKQGMIELKGHRSVGGIRASIYNAMPLEGVLTLAGFMRGFRDDHAA